LLKGQHGKGYRLFCPILAAAQHLHREHLSARWSHGGSRCYRNGIEALAFNARQNSIDFLYSLYKYSLQDFWKDFMEKLTARQGQILDFVREWISDHGMPPTRAEICSALGFRSPNAAEEHLRTLERKGAIEMMPGTSRGIRLVGSEPAGLALVGSVAAGSPILAQENHMGRYPVNPTLFTPKADYLLKVRGMSMRDVGIMDGDWLAVHQTRHAQNGQIVVARLGEEVTVKRLKVKGHTAYLVAENPEFDPIVVDLRQQQLEIEGLAVGVIRSLN
jgi:repressor LexA